MDFWRGFEGNTVAERYLLESFLYPEGRSGFFSASSAVGETAVVRLTQPLPGSQAKSIDEARAILDPWETVRKLGHPNLVTIKQTGRTVLGTTPFLFAALENADASLAGMLAERPMTVEETTEIARSLTAALQALHHTGLVHGYIQPSSVMAMGETVKLRADCVRFFPEGREGMRLKADDVRALAILLLLALTRERKLLNAGLPAPFDQIVGNGIGGSWGLEEVATALRIELPQPVDRFASSTRRPKIGRAESGTVEAGGQPILPFPEASAGSPVAGSLKVSARRLLTLPPGTLASALTSGVVPGIGVALLLLAAISVWYLFNPMTQEERAIAYPKKNAAAGPSTASAAVLSFGARNSPSPVAAAGSAAAAVAAEDSGVTPSHGTWRVVVFAYTQPSQARKKASDIARNHLDWKPHVFSPNGDSPYLVTLGGPMSHDEAIALARQARAEGVASDARAEDYGAK